MKLKENWRDYAPETVEEFLRCGYEGKEHPSRLKTLALLDGITSVLDVGCGTGVLFELIREHRPDIDYTGIDVTENFIRSAQRHFPSEAHRFQQKSIFELDFDGRQFDAVICRHVLEHLPDYKPAVQHLYTLAGKKVIIVFFLPPQSLRFGRKKDEKFETEFFFHTYDSGKFLDHLLGELSPTPREIRIYPNQGTSDPSKPWGKRQNVVYEILRTD